MIGYFLDSATEVEVNHWTVMFGYFHDLATGVEADHWTVMFGYFHNQTALRVVYFSWKLDVAQSWCSHVGVQTRNKMVIMQRTVSPCA
jgi:hypothetical protein